MKLDNETAELLQNLISTMELGFNQLPDFPQTSISAKAKAVLNETAVKLQDNYPYFHPYYAGQMLKPPHPVAQLAYFLATWINPNNHALDGGRASSAMEKEAVAEIAAMFGWEKHLGHLCSGGTMANLEALWVAGQLHPGKMIVASEQAHYTHERISKVLGLSFASIPADNRGKMDIDALESFLLPGNVGTVVCTMGTTAVGAVDPLSQILELQKKYDFRIHADCAYGGYFSIINNLRAETADAFSKLSSVDSLVIDPHKHGLQPYGCGCVLFKDPSVGSLYRHDSPYTYFSSAELHLGEISLECSRPGASAVALWATQKLLPLIEGGEFASMLEMGRQAALHFYQFAKNNSRMLSPFAPELDIVFWAPRSARVSTSSKLSKQVFNLAAEKNLHLALAELPVTFFGDNLQDMEVDCEKISCVRSVFMKPEHLTHINEITGILDQILNDLNTGD